MSLLHFFTSLFPLFSTLILVILLSYGVHFLVYFFVLGVLSCVQTLIEGVLHFLIHLPATALLSTEILALSRVSDHNTC